MATEAKTERLSLTELKTRLEYQVLLPAQKKYVDALLESGENTGTFNFVAAAAISYPGAAKNPRSLAVRSSQLHQHKNVKRVLNLAFGAPQDEDAEFLGVIRRAVMKSIKNDIATNGAISDATARALQVWERKSGQKLKAAFHDK